MHTRLGIEGWRFAGIICCRRWWSGPGNILSRLLTAWHFDRWVSLWEHFLFSSETFLNYKLRTPVDFKFDTSFRRRRRYTLGQPPNSFTTRYKDAFIQERGHQVLSTVAMFVSKMSQYTFTSLFFWPRGSNLTKEEPLDVEVNCERLKGPGQIKLHSVPACERILYISNWPISRYVKVQVFYSKSKPQSVTRWLPAVANRFSLSLTSTLKIDFVYPCTTNCQTPVRKSQMRTVLSPELVINNSLLPGKSAIE